jgi:hypothetical protein
MSDQATTLPYINVPASLTSSNTITKFSVLARERSDFLGIARRQLKAEVFYQRNKMVRMGEKHYQTWATQCPNCGEYLKEGDLHEWLITRGEVDGAPFEWQMQIYVPCNVVICHPGRCHIDLQHGEAGARKCLSYITEWHTAASIYEWLYAIKDVITIADEKTRWLWTSLV